jgi:sec-independent protein translocase protein TatC
MSDENKLKVFEHLDELRKRLIVSGLTIFIGFIICFSYSDYLLILLKLPLDYKMRFSFDAPFLHFIKSLSEMNLYFIAPQEAFWVHCKMAIVFSIFLSFPVIVTQVWLFVKPALYKEEKKLAVPFISFSILLFLIGFLFCFFIVLPFAMDFLLGYKTENLIPMLTLERYIDFTLKFLLAFGLIFQTPVIILLLTRLNILTPKILRENRKYAVLIIFIVAAVLTPTPDMFNQCLMALPLMFLYEVSIMISKLFYVDSDSD